MSRLSKHPEILEQIIALEKERAPREDPRWKPINEAMMDGLESMPYRSRPRHYRKRGSAPLPKTPKRPPISEFTRRKERRLNKYPPLIERGLNVNELAEALGITRNMVSTDLRRLKLKPLERYNWQVSNEVTGGVEYHKSYRTFAQRLGIGYNRLSLRRQSKELVHRGWHIKHGRWFERDGEYYEVEDEKHE